MKATKINSRLGLRVTLLVAMWFWCFASGNTYALFQATTQQITATGSGAIYGGDMALARDRAIDDALRRAVEQAMGTWVQSEVVVQNYMVVEDNILNWSSGYVRNYQIVSEYKKTPDLYEVTLQAEVEMADLMKDMDAVKSLLAKAGNPRIMIIMNEQNIGESYDQYHFFNVDMTVAETAMMQTFMDKGFEVVDPTTVRSNIKRAQALAALEGDNKAAAAIGQSFEAEVVITGKAIAKVASTQMKVLGDMKSCQANVTARVVKTDVGTVIATGSQQAPAVHIDEITGGTQAIEKASKKLADELIEKILKKWREEFYTMTTVKLQLTGVQSPSQLNDFKSVLKYYIRGIKDVYQRNVAGGAAELDIKITGNADQLARELERKDLGKFKVQIVGISPNRINLKLMEKQAVEPALEDTTGMN